GNGSGLGTNMARGMGEGWSDFYAISMLSEAADNPLGIHAVGGYLTFNITNGYTSNYYYGMRRFPYAVISSLGANGRPHNPLTFRHLNSDCNLQIGTTTTAIISAYPRGPLGVTQCDQIYNAAEIWAVTLWEVRGQLVQNNGAETGNRKALQFITDGMKLAPLNPTMLQERDAIIAAAQVSGTATDVRDVWRGFALRGFGRSAQIIAASPANVVEAFDTPNIEQTPNFTFTDANGDGFPEPGEVLSLTIPLKNSSGEIANNVNLQVMGGNSASYGTIQNNQTVTRTVNFVVPFNAPCGGSINLTFNVTSSLGDISFTRPLMIGRQSNLMTQNFDGVAAPTLPENWISEQTGSGANWVTTTDAPDSAPNSAFIPNPATSGGADLTSQSVLIAPFGVSPTTYIAFRNNYNTEATWDGGVLEISINGGAFQDIIAAGGSFISGGYNGTLRGTGNPLAGRQGWTGNSGGYIDSVVQLPFAVFRQNVRFRWRLGHDSSTGATGWRIDNVRVYNYLCGDPAPLRARADFDGDGKTDVSVYRNGVWYVNGSNSGFAAWNWGFASDTPIVGNFDFDFKTDSGVFRSGSPNTNFYIRRSDNGQLMSFVWGVPGDIPLIGDFNGGFLDQVSIYRSNSVYVHPNSAGGQMTTFSLAAAGKLFVMDYNGDGRSDPAIYTPQTGNWSIRTMNGTTDIRWGLSEDQPVPADYDGDGKDDIAVFRPSNGTWYILKSTGGAIYQRFGLPNDIPVPGDYDGDRLADIAVYRDGVWYINASALGFRTIHFGIAGDKPIPNLYLPQN
ncbi:MAG TPA: M36 family metallopeptidase, partial [Pyrinomonadaceae bacterium]|nr:M36 family metallopeptidase [Pyrinomonadaceae bacterium]